MDKRDDNRQENDLNKGYFGGFGGMFVPEILISALKELEKNYLKYRDDPGFKEELSYLLKSLFLCSVVSFRYKK